MNTLSNRHMHLSTFNERTKKQGHPTDYTHTWLHTFALEYYLRLGTKTFW